MSQKQIKRYRRAIKKEEYEQRDLLAEQVLETIVTSKFPVRLAFAWMVIKGKKKDK